MKKIISFIFALTLLTSNSFADITFWTTEVQPARMEKQMEMAKSFESKTGIKVEVIPVEEKRFRVKSHSSCCSWKLTRRNLPYSSVRFALGRGRDT